VPTPTYAWCLGIGGHAIPLSMRVCGPCPCSRWAHGNTCVCGWYARTSARARARCHLWKRVGTKLVRFNVQSLQCATIHVFRFGDTRALPVLETQPESPRLACCYSPRLQKGQPKNTCFPGVFPNRQRILSSELATFWRPLDVKSFDVELSLSTSNCCTVQSIGCHPRFARPVFSLRRTRRYQTRLLRIRTVVGTGNVGWAPGWARCLGTARERRG